MNYATKRKIMNNTVYIVLGLVLVAVICVTAATLIGLRAKKTASPELPSDVAAGELSDKPSQGQKDPPTPANPTPGGNSGDSSPLPSGETPAVEPVKPVFFFPANGALQKEYSPSQPIRSLTMNDYRTHNGIDIGAPAGSGVAALSDGVVSDIYSDPMMGMCLCIDHGNGLVSTYKNLSFTLPEGIAKGVEVKAGQIVASVGDTALIELAEAEHLHFEITVNGKHVDPGSYLDLSALTVDAGSE